MRFCGFCENNSKKLNHILPESQARNSSLLLESIHLSFTVIQPSIFFLSYSFSQSDFHFILFSFRYVPYLSFSCILSSTRYLVIFIRITQQFKPIAILLFIENAHISLSMASLLQLLCLSCSAFILKVIPMGIA